MSTYIYLECVTHKTRAEGESGQHTYDLPQLRADIVDKDKIRKGLEVEMRFEDHEWFRNNTAFFLRNHGDCELNIIDEYGKSYPLTEEDTEEFLENEYKKLIHKLEVLGRERIELDARVANLRKAKDVTTHDSN